MSKFNELVVKPKILFVMHMPPPVHGAAMVGQYIHDSELINREFECHYVNMSVASRLEDVGKGGWHKMKDILRKIREIRSAVNSVRPDMVYVTPNSAGAPFYKDFIIVEMLKMMGQRVVMHFHNKGVATRQHCWIDNELYRHYFKNVRLILLADALYGDVKKYIPMEKVYVCPNAIPEIAMATECVRAKLNDNESEASGVTRILWLTNIMRTKGIMEFISALKIMKEKGVTFYVDFVGGLTKEMTGEEFDTALSMMGLNGCCEYHGAKYGEDKYRFFRNADIFVLPSYTEAQPVSILEAMQFALPVVASNVGGVSAEVDDGVTGFILGGSVPVMLNTFRPDPREIAGKLETLIKNTRLRSRMGMSAHEKYDREFTLSVFENRMTEVLRKCLN